MSGPEEIWLDPRVLRTMETEPDPDAAVPLVKYVSNERMLDLVRATHGGAEFFIQISNPSHGQNPDALLALTNYGRIFIYSFLKKEWSLEIEIPDFDGSPDT